MGTEGQLCCLQRAVQKVMKRDMSDAPLHIVFSLFDANQDGNLASAELVTVGALMPSDFLPASFYMRPCS